MKLAWYYRSGTKKAILSIFAVAGVISCGSLRSLALDGDDVPTNHSMKSAIVSVMTPRGGACTGAALPNGAILTAAHCVLNETPDGIDHSKWSRTPSDVRIVYYLGRRQETRDSETVSIFIDEGRDIALVKAKGGHPKTIATFRAPIGQNEITDLPLFTKPLVLIAGRGGHGDGSEGIDNWVIQYASGQASYSSFAPEGFFVLLPPDKGVCGGDSGSPVFLIGSPNLPADVQQFRIVGVVAGVWRGGSYSEVRKKCSHELVVTSTIAHPSAGVDSSAWLTKILDGWKN